MLFGFVFLFTFSGVISAFVFSNAYFGPLLGLFGWFWCRGRIPDLIGNRGLGWFLSLFLGSFYPGYFERRFLAF
jgi:hypothetical protein